MLDSENGAFDLLGNQHALIPNEEQLYISIQSKNTGINDWIQRYLFPTLGLDHGQGVSSWLNRAHG